MRATYRIELRSGRWGAAVCPVYSPSSVAFQAVTMATQSTRTHPRLGIDKETTTQMKKRSAKVNTGTTLYRNTTCMQYTACAQPRLWQTPRRGFATYTQSSKHSVGAEPKDGDTNENDNSNNHEKEKQRVEEGDEWLDYAVVPGCRRVQITGMSLHSTDSPAFSRLVAKLPRSKLGVPSAAGSAAAGSTHLLTTLWPSGQPLPRELAEPGSDWTKQAEGQNFLREDTCDLWVRAKPAKEDVAHVQKAIDEFFENKKSNKQPEFDMTGVRLKRMIGQEDRETVLQLLQKKFGSNGQDWCDPSEISAEFVAKCEFVFAVSEEHGVVGCLGATKGLLFEPSNSGVRISKRRYSPIETDATDRFWEVTHGAVLDAGNGRYSGLAGVMQDFLLDEILGPDPHVLMATTFDCNKDDGGGAWKLGFAEKCSKAGSSDQHRSVWQYTGCLYRFTGVVAPPNRWSWKENNHLLMFIRPAQQKDKP
eukprot:TRINITY_DN503_c0_g1_i2.p1 TRINITY_DN503_c0_g1~~TRINITY_DN503_c0_g1_i2.p1  ORF type:complete len:476 (+),score=59.72 TRINITY_DN503_c0_g1_i2:77-1504(+)